MYPTITPEYRFNGHAATHRQIYHWLADPQREDAVNKALTIQGYRSSRIASDLFLEEVDGISFYMFAIPQNWEHDATPEKISECIRFEIWKINYIEGRAAIAEYHLGTHSVPYRVLFWDLEFPCASLEQYVETIQALYLEILEKQFISLSPTHADWIKKDFVTAVDQEFASLATQISPNEILANRRSDYHTWTKSQLPDFSKGKDSHSPNAMSKAKRNTIEAQGAAVTVLSEHQP